MSRGLAILPLDDGGRDWCAYCGVTIGWGEPFDICGSGDPICGACAKTPGYRNGPASASEAACVRLQGEAREQLEALTAAKEHLELAELFLLDLCAKDIVPREVRSALDCLQRGLAAYTTTQGDDQ
jgi:hypothetical protein